MIRDEAALLAQWRADLAVLVPDTSRAAVEASARDLLASWSAAGRGYHAPPHLAEVLAALEELELDTAQPGTDGALVARLAAWYHDAVYDPIRPQDNEIRSANRAVDELTRLGVEPVTVARVRGLVLATTAHDLPGAHATPESRAFHDADLWILAAPSPRFDEYCSQVRAEYAHVSDADYARGRSAVLSPLVDRPRLYATAHGLATWEAVARENVARELARLTG